MEENSMAKGHHPDWLAEECIPGDSYCMGKCSDFPCDIIKDLHKDNKCIDDCPYHDDADNYMLEDR